MAPEGTNFISDDEVDRALSWLRDNATAIGAARRRMILAERMVKHVKALMMKASDKKSVGAQEMDAYASQEYLDAIFEEADAAGEFEKIRALREAAAAKIESWRTACSNIRMMKI